MIPGITVPALNNEPGIYSARYAGLNATDKDNNTKLIENLNAIGLEITPAFYTACIAIIYNNRGNLYSSWFGCMECFK